ncbi:MULTISPECIES: nitroreductase family protein [unclassified Amycolatopsis]|uniref:nitroreductase family protein n=1 Tax=unclassified Amycolatopsis TaxID=2618356 RepID=UPI002E0D9BAE|nr:MULTISPECIES: nitroreductase family protein [unclassified Amycolatopsis]WSJ79044.1 nitroreductase family protein [Amycolatopsis sp. NBC_01307]WSK77470.1 nitroreductase family protein [Amycolatopsis sp. NBC_01286]
MEFRDVIRKRRMVRSFTDEPLDDETVRRLLDVANRGPSAGFSQGYALLALRTEEERAEFWLALGQDPAKGNPVKRAPLIVVPLASKQAYLDRYTQADKNWTDRAEDRWAVPYWYIDTGFTALLTLLATVDAGLGAKFFGILPPVLDSFRERFGIPAEYTPVGAIAIGHRDYRLDPDPPWRPAIARKPLEDVVHWGKW